MTTMNALLGRQTPNIQGFIAPTYEPLEQSSSTTIADDWGLIDTEVEWQRMNALIVVGTGGWAHEALNFLKPPSYWISVPFEAESPELPDFLSVKATLEDVKEIVDLPVQDLAKMLGLSRRHFYNLLNGHQPGRQSEESIRWTHKRLNELSDAVDGLYVTTRDALLTPITDDDKSLFEVLSEKDRPKSEKAFEALMSRLRNEDLAGMLPRPAPAFSPLGDDVRISDRMRKTL